MNCNVITSKIDFLYTYNYIILGIITLNLIFNSILIFYFFKDKKDNYNNIQNNTSHSLLKNYDIDNHQILEQQNMHDLDIDEI